MTNALTWLDQPGGRCYGLAQSRSRALAGCSGLAGGGSSAADGAREASFADGDGPIQWVLPGPRRLDEAVFGAPENPKGTEESVGVPVDERLTNDAGSAFTRTATPTPFSDRTTDIDGSFEYAVTDATPIDTRSSADTATAEFEFTGPSGETAYAVTLQETLPVGPEHPIMGGTAVELVMHGVTGIGTRMQPTQLAYGTLWGRATFERDGETLAENRLLHVMTTERVRNPSTGRLLFDADLPHEGAQTHVILPPVEVTPDGPRSAPVPTGNGQPFVHLNFFGSSVEGVETLG